MSLSGGHLLAVSGADKVTQQLYANIESLYCCKNRKQMTYKHINKRPAIAYKYGTVKSQHQNPSQKRACIITELFAVSRDVFKGGTFHE